MGIRASALYCAQIGRPDTRASDWMFGRSRRAGYPGCGGRMSGLVKLAMLLSGSGVSGYLGWQPDFRGLGKGRMSGLATPDVQGL